MREAFHVIDKVSVTLPFSTTKNEVSNFKKLAEKDIYQCPYCHAILRVKHGDIRGLYFTHQHSEACEESKVIDQAEKRYTKQTAREAEIHNTIINIVYDELKTQSKIKPHIAADYGFKAKSNLKEFPDIWVKLASKEYALSIITNVKSSVDSKLANQIIKRHQYFLEQGMEPIWFIEKKEQSIEKDINAIVLWDAELTISTKTNEDKEWDTLLSSMVSNKRFFQYFNYPVSKDTLEIDVRSMYYIYSNDDQTVVKVQRFLKDRTIKPYRAFLLNEGYEIPFAEALVIKNDFLLSNPKIDDQLRKAFKQKFQKLHIEFQERLRILEEQRKIEEDHKQKIFQEMALQEEERRKKLLQQLAEQKSHTNLRSNSVSSYEDLKRFLRERIGMTQSQQQELWSKYMPKIGYKNSITVWELFVEHDCNSFDELRSILNNYFSVSK